MSRKKDLPVYKVEKQDFRLGGCANVAVNLNGLGHEIYLISYVGEDSDGQIICKLLKKKEPNLVMRILFFCLKMT